MTRDYVSGEVCELLADGASWSTVVKEGEPVKVAGSGATASIIGAITSGIGIQNFVDEIGELRAIFGHMLKAVGVQILENNLDDLHSLREEDGIAETMDPQDLLGSLLLADIDLIILGCDLVEMVDNFTYVEDNIGLLETRFVEEAVFVFVFPKDVMSLVNLTLLSLFFGVTATNISLELFMLGQTLNDVVPHPVPFDERHFGLQKFFWNLAFGGSARRTMI
nr:hypothetical protein [Tanacetum cinerariifolium]